MSRAVKPFCMILKWWIYVIIHMSETNTYVIIEYLSLLLYRLYNTRMNLNVYCGLQFIIIYQYLFIYCNTSTTLI